MLCCCLLLPRSQSVHASPVSRLKRVRSISLLFLLSRTSLPKFDFRSHVEVPFDCAFLNCWIMQWAGIDADSWLRKLLCSKELVTIINARWSCSRVVRRRCLVLLRRRRPLRPTMSEPRRSGFGRRTRRWWRPRSREDGTRSCSRLRIRVLPMSGHVRLFFLNAYCFLSPNVCVVLSMVEWMDMRLELERDRNCCLVGWSSNEHVD